MVCSSLRQSLEGRYAGCAEANRLSQDNSHRVEFLTSMRMFERYLLPKSRVLDLGAGTGCYSIPLAQQGHRMVARDLLPEHIDALRADPRRRELRIDAGVGDGRDLSEFPDGVFDAVLCLGPIYHIGEPDGRRQCISECLRVLRPGGLLFVAYINRFPVFPHMVRQRREYLEDDYIERYLSNEARVSRQPGSIWFFDSPKEIEELLSGFGVERLANVGTDGIGALLSDLVNSFDEHQFEQWMKYHYRICEEPSILGYSSHGLLICRAE